MGMPIEESMKVLQEVPKVMPITKESINVALETMRKFQKIKEQVDIAIDKENFAISGARLIQIREIINGNEDC